MKVSRTMNSDELIKMVKPYLKGASVYVPETKRVQDMMGYGGVKISNCSSVPTGIRRMFNNDETEEIVTGRYIKDFCIKPSRKGFIEEFEGMENIGIYVDKKEKVVSFINDSGHRTLPNGFMKELFNDCYTLIKKDVCINIYEIGNYLVNGTFVQSTTDGRIMFATGRDIGETFEFRVFKNNTLPFASFKAAWKDGGGNYEYEKDKITKISGNSWWG